jgi:hypothetical protein
VEEWTLETLRTHFEDLLSEHEKVNKGRSDEAIAAVALALETTNRALILASTASEKRIRGVEVTQGEEKTRLSNRIIDGDISMDQRKASISQASRRLLFLWGAVIISLALNVYTLIK